MKLMTRALILGWLFITAWIPAAAEVPQTIAYQGRLSQGSQLFTGVVSMTSRLYTRQSGGTPIWTETHPSVQVSNGQFGVSVLGLGTPDGDPQ